MSIETETVETPAGVYRVEFIADDCADQPYNEGFALIVNGGRDRIDIDTVPASATRFVPNDPVRVAHDVVLSKQSDYWDHDYRSGAALLRYLRLRGFKGVTLVDSEYRPTEPSTDRFKRVDGIAWVPDDVPDDRADDYTRASLGEWHAWATGDVFGYNVTGPDGADVEDGSVWGYYGYDRERGYVMSEARSTIDYDVTARVDAANRAGAGYVGGDWWDTAELGDWFPTSIPGVRASIEGTNTA